MQSQKGAERGRNRRRLQNRSKKSATGRRCVSPQKSLKGQNIYGHSNFLKSQRTTDEPSSDSCILQVTGPSSQTWQIGPSWEKRVRTREGRQAINLCKRSVSSVEVTNSLLGQCSWVFPSPNCTISSHHLIPSRSKCQVKQSCKNRNGLESPRLGFASQPYPRRAQ